MYVKQLELTNFKSFGGTTAVPTLTGFTVISGPNGSGKSNLLDAILFALGLSGSKGMRAERLPDLVNHAQLKRGHSVVETKVTVSFALEPQDLELLGDEAQSYIAPPPNVVLEPESKAQPETMPQNGTVAPESASAPSLDGVTLLETALSNATDPEWRVTRRLRVTKQGTYTSTYAMNGEPCTLVQLHSRLSRLRIYSEGYNVVLQGDVTGVITMNPRQRREIIDELAGVADFDRKINQSREKLEGVKEQEDRFRIVEQELVEQRDRLARDRLKAEKYKILKTEFHQKSGWDGVLNHRQLGEHIAALNQTLVQEKDQQTALQTQIQSVGQQATQLADELLILNEKVKALGEKEQLKIQAEIVTGEAELRQLERQQEALIAGVETHNAKIAQLQQQIQGYQQNIQTLVQTQKDIEAQEIQQLLQARDAAQASLNQLREQSQDLASSADTWIQQQSDLRQQIETLRQTLSPQRSEQVLLRERCEQFERQHQQRILDLSQLETHIQTQQLTLTEVKAESQQDLAGVQELAEGVTQLDQAVSTHQKTLERLLQELRDKQRQLDKLEAQDQAQQEAQGTYASQIILKSDLDGVCGLVANLGGVDPKYQIALETAAGARLGHIVVEDDRVAAAGIELLKQQRGGRATFLPLNKLRFPQNLPDLGFLDGALGYAMALIAFDPRYEAVFANVLGNTVVFDSLKSARRYLGRYRMVTLDGELLEPSGAMTGGSRGSRSTLKFGKVDPAESSELKWVRDRLGEIQQLLTPLEQNLAKSQAQLRERTQQLGNQRQQHRETQLRSAQLEKELNALMERQIQLQQQTQIHQQSLTDAQARLATLEKILPAQEAALATLQTQLADLEQSQTHGEWKTLQASLQQQEQQLAQREAAVRDAQQKLQSVGIEQERLNERIQLSETEIQSTQGQIAADQAQQATNLEQQQALEQSLFKLRLDMEALEEKIGTQKQARDHLEAKVRERTEAKQKLTWQWEKLVETHREHQEQLKTMEMERSQLETALPNPLPEIPAELTLEDLKQQLKSLQLRLDAMEPVNMLAIEEYDRTQARLEELTQKLETLERERTEILMRVENFTTLRLQSFQEAFDVVNVNFQRIFGGLSDGDGFLQLENPQDPFLGGLNLVAHPKGKPVQRLASMSGGEKSLTALSFIFALQQYRPSPFYALDEVDSFLDGVNVEKLARIIQAQAKETQFLVVSHRRPMIDAADRTIGVTQAKGTHTQVIGMQIRTQADQ